MTNTFRIIAASVIIIMLCMLSSVIFGQGITNNGGHIVATTGSNIYINGTSGNYTSQSNGIISNDSGITITIQGNWLNNSSNSGFSGSGATIVLAGDVQTIGGTNSSSFYNLTCSGTSSLNTDLLISNLLYLSSNQAININGQTLRLACVIVGSGKIKGSETSNLEINGSGAFGNINFDQTNSSARSLKNLTINRNSSTVTLGNPLEVTGNVYLTNGTLASAGNLKLVSNTNGTAAIPTITGSGAITGNVIAERFIPASARRWRFMSSNTTYSTIEDWRNEIFITGAGTGTTIGTINSGGFDATASNAPSVYYYVPGSGWATPTSTSDTLSAGRGYRVFVRGDRSSYNRLNGTDNSQNEVTMNLTGLINQGDIIMPLSYANGDGWNLLGNPYPCQYDWKQFWNEGNTGFSGAYYANVDPSIYTWDPSSNSYKSYNAASNGGTISNGTIASGQSFFVKATGASPAMTFREQFKSSSLPTQLFKSGLADEMRIRLVLDSVDYDDYILKFRNGTISGNDMYDITKMSNPTANISSYGNDSILHSLDVRPLNANGDTVNLKITGSNGSFRLFFNSIPVTPGKIFLLKDHYLNNTAVISKGMRYSFVISSAIPATQGNSRFTIYMLNTGSLPLQFGTFEATGKYNKTELVWNTLSEQNTSHFVVERSNDNLEFLPIGNIKASVNSSVTVAYSFIDDQPRLKGINYYRIKQVDNNENVNYSDLRSVTFESPDKAINLVNIFPNPVTGKYINLKLSDNVNRNLSVEIFDILGRKVLNSIPVKTENGNFTIPVGSLMQGVYFLSVSQNNQLIENEKFIIE